MSIQKKPAPGDSPALTVDSPRLTAVMIGVGFTLIIGAGVVRLLEEPTVGSSEPPVEGEPDALIDLSSRRAAPEVEQRFEAIEAELEDRAEAPPWAGTYCYGDGLGTNVSFSLAPESGFAFTWHGCLGLYGQNYGSVRLQDQRILLECRMENAPLEFGHTRTEFVPVRWGDRQFLLGLDQLFAFGNDVRSGAEVMSQRWGPYLVQVAAGDPWSREPGKVFGEPQAPAEFADLVKGPLIRCLVVEVLPAVHTSATKDSPITQRVKLHLGASSGVTQGMRFLCEEFAPPRLVKARVVSVEPGDCIAEFQLSEGMRPPANGWAFSHYAAER